jgi:exosortase/archaeosortase family protein
MIRRILILFLGVCALFLVVYLIWLVKPGISFRLSVIAVAPIAYLLCEKAFKRSLLQFIARYGIVFVALVFLEYTVRFYFAALANVFCGMTAHLVGGILSLSGAECSVLGSTIELRDPIRHIDVIPACLGGAIFWLYIALVLAVPGVSWRNRLTGVCAGIVLIFGFNISRLLLSVYTQWRTGIYIHDYFYYFSPVFVLLLWGLWVCFLNNKRLVLVR